ncbi:MAG: hypothetical protein ACFCUT_03710 [Kiloniellaceae bacterium]
MKRNDTRLTVHSEHQDDVDASASRITVTDVGPHYWYRQHGRGRISRHPLARVVLRMNDGPWNGWAKVNDLEAAGLLRRASTVIAAPLLVIAAPIGLPLPAGAR